ncbi:hypothetical protein LRX75_22195 [Rhizobium sp. DKSPLA3]|uniref:Uncharacterized protein n=1 Tax=Rhizobium quercicola TaxID=2901226 RepID=A0A9X1NWG0_9HYPH|nr:hypothetical protein [Rhizobium quercicola]MCD7111743.1 hypothetical protein [Rhizobium quercicola]
MSFGDKVAKAENEIKQAVDDLANEGAYDVDDYDGFKFHGSFLENGTPGPNPVFTFYFKHDKFRAVQTVAEIEKRCPQAKADGIRFELRFEDPALAD